MSMRSSLGRMHASVDRVAAVVVTIALALALTSFASALVVSTAVILELEEHPVHWVLAVVALGALLSIPGWVLLTFRSVVRSAREIPGTVGSWYEKALVHRERLRSADGGIATGTAAAQAAWVGRREVGTLKAALAVTRLSFVVVALVCAALVPFEVLLALAVVSGTIIF